MTWRRLQVLIDHLPPECATFRALNGWQAWTTTEHLLAVIHDAINHASWAATQVQSKNKVAQPKPLPRPGHKEGRAAPSAEGIAYLEDLRQRHREETGQ